MATQQLMKGMYGDELTATNGLFDLRCGQRCHNSLIHAGGWYNKAGEKLGWGDLSIENLLRIYGEVANGEFFVVLGETGSFWNFITHPGAIGAILRKIAYTEELGRSFIAEHARFIIGHHRLCFVDSHREHGYHHEKFAMNTRILGIEFEVLSVDEAKQLLASLTPLASPATP